MVYFILVLFVCWNLFCIIANLKIKCVTEAKNVSVLFYKNLKSSFLHDSHIWLWGFFTLLDSLARSVTCRKMWQTKLFVITRSVSKFRSCLKILIFLLTVLICTRVRPRFFDQVGHQTTNGSIGNKDCADFQSQFSTSKIIRILLKKIFIEKYQFRGTFFVFIDFV